MSQSEPHSSLPDPGRGNPISRVVRGAGYLLGALPWMLKHPKLTRLLVAPLMINLALLVTVLGLALYFATDVTRWIWDQPDGWLVALWYVTVVLVVLALLAVGYVVFLVLSALLGSAFYDAMSERTEAIELGARPPSEPVTVGGVVEDIASGVGDAGRSLVTLLTTLPLFLLNFVPVIGSLAYLGITTGLAGYQAALEGISPVAERRGLGRTERSRTVRGNKAVFAGFAAAGDLLMLVPIVNLIALPATIVGGTRLFLHLEAHQRTPRARTGAERAP